MDRKRSWLPGKGEALNGEDAWFFYNYYKAAPFNFFNEQHKMRAIAVSGSGTYILSGINRKNTLEVYDSLIAAAKREIRAKKMYEGIDIDTDTSNERESKNIFEKTLMQIGKSIKTELGAEFSTKTLPQISYEFKSGGITIGEKVSKRNPDKKRKFIEEFEEEEAFQKFLLGKILAGSAKGADFILTDVIQKSETAQKILVKLSRDVAKRIETKESGQEAATIGFLNEALSLWAAEQVSNVVTALPGGTEKVKVTDRNNKPITFPTKSGGKRYYNATTTTDARITLAQTGEGMTDTYNFSIKLAQDLSSVKYKEFTGAGDPLTHIAEWSHLTRTYIGWAKYNDILYDSLGDYMAATFASIALGGFKEDRALYLLKSNGARLTIESLDVALRKLKQTAPLRVRGFSVVQEGDLEDNLRQIADDINVGGEIDISRMYQSSALLKEINFNYKLQTMGPYKSIIG